MSVGDWVPCLNYGQQLSLELQLPTILSFDQVLVAVGPSDVGSLGEVATVELEQSVMTKRVVGDVLFRVSLVQAHSLLIHERIRVGLRDDQGVMSFFSNDFQLGTEANEPFLWERCGLMDHPGGGGAVVVNWPDPVISHPGWGHVDVRVARRLARQQVLVYSIKVTSITFSPFDVEDQFTFFPHLRTWARALG